MMEHRFNRSRKRGQHAHVRVLPSPTDRVDSKTSAKADGRAAATDDDELESLIEALLPAALAVQ